MAKFRATFKDPDYYLEDEKGEDLSSTELTSVRKLTDKLFQWNEYVTIELDTETGTARVVPTAE